MEIRFLKSFDVLGDEWIVGEGSALTARMRRVVLVGRLIDELGVHVPTGRHAQGVLVAPAKALRLANGDGQPFCSRWRLPPRRLGGCDRRAPLPWPRRGGSSRRVRGTPSTRRAPSARRSRSRPRGPALADFAYEPFAQAEIARLDELADWNRGPDRRLLGRGATRRSSPSSRRSSTSTRTEKGSAASSCSRSTARAAGRRAEVYTVETRR